MNNSGCGVIKMVSMRSVPIEVWNSVRDKWCGALNDGWNDYKLWCGCALCDWVRSQDVTYYHVCRCCPLVHTGWCDGNGMTSKLSILYYGGSDEEWCKGIMEFLEWIKPYCGDE